MADTFGSDDGILFRRRQTGMLEPRAPILPHEALDHSPIFALDQELAGRRWLEASHYAVNQVLCRFVLVNIEDLAAVLANEFGGLSIE